MSSPDSSSTGKLGISPHLNQRFSKIKREYHNRLFNYEKEFNITTSTSKSTHREKILRESMLAYTERVRNIAKPRVKPDSDDGDMEEKLPLEVRAKHIPKFPARRNLQRRPASLDELIGKSNLAKQEKSRLAKRPKSASRIPTHVSLPALPNRIQGRSHHVKISFVSASDLYDFVDYSLRNRGTKKETLQFLQMEKDILTKTSTDNQKRLTEHADNNLDKLEVTSTSILPPIKHKDKENVNPLVCDNQNEASSTANANIENTNSSSNKKSTQNEKKAPIVPLKMRPNRAKRMKIRQPNLGAIPEDDISTQQTSQTPERLAISPPPKMSPRNVITMDSNLVSIPENDSNGETGFLVRQKRYKTNHRKLDLSRHISYSKDSLLSNDKRLIDIDDLDTQSSSTNKLKAQKKFKKLIFLRDIPERK